MLRTGHIFLWSLAVFGHTSTTRAGWVFFSYEKIFCEDKCMIKTALFSDSASQCDTCSKRILGEQGWFDVIYSTATKLICSKTTCKMRKSQQCLTWFHKDLACGLWHATYTPNTSTLNQTCWKCRLERNDHTKRSKLNTGKIPSKQSRDIVFFSHCRDVCRDQLWQGYTCTVDANETKQQQSEHACGFVHSGLVSHNYLQSSTTQSPIKHNHVWGLPFEKAGGSSCMHIALLRSPLKAGCLIARRLLQQMAPKSWFQTWKPIEQNVRMNSVKSNKVKPSDK